MAATEMAQDWRQQIGCRVTQLRESRGLIGSDLASMLKVSKPAVYQIEAGINGLSIPVACRLCEIFQVSLDWLILGR